MLSSEREEAPPSRFRSLQVDKTGEEYDTLPRHVLNLALSDGDRVSRSAISYANGRRSSQMNGRFITQKM